MATKSSKRKRKPYHQWAASSRSDFSFTITRIAVAQICQSVGYNRTHRAALDALTLVATKYMQTLAQSAASFCNALNRTQSNLLDLANALHDLVAVHDGGFSGASVLRSRLSPSGSTVIRDLAGFVGSTEEMPFAKPIHRREGRRNRENEQHFAQALSRKAAHIPDWLPGFSELGSEEICEERAAETKLWENSDFVLGKEMKEILEDGNCGDLMKERERVKFVIGTRKRLDGNAGIISEVDKKQVENVKKPKR